MTESIALYRKYRPKSFKQVRNQEHIVSVLKGAIEKGMIPHALLFTGSRGTGKTTVARIFAHEIGAEDVDIYEIDAASNRGIDDIRALREAVHTLPYTSPYKVYIIDEVHMLTKEAFNALLKTLEEPPAHVVFVLATTEQDALLDTITSRCQVFQFRAPSRPELRELVIDVAKKEDFTLDTTGADTIAIAADGSYRDALGIVQKVIMASKDSTADADEVAAIVGAPKTQLLFTLITALHEKDAITGLRAVREAHEAHIDMKLFLKLLLERVRSIILARYSIDSKEEVVAHYTKEEQERILTYAADASSPIHSHLLLRLLEAAEQVGKVYLPQLPLEVAIVDLCQK
ncbi:DNA polymerase III subunit gamma/tau [Candidatus Kaiserbacteria bacterium]|nr:DNA polymerase III subunit gamma/tau [Candidatus Kaiserbacteria bacterium]